MNSSGRSNAAYFCRAKHSSEMFHQAPPETKVQPAKPLPSPKLRERDRLGREHKHGEENQLLAAPFAFLRGEVPLRGTATGAGEVSIQEPKHPSRRLFAAGSQWDFGPSCREAGNDPVALQRDGAEHRTRCGDSLGTGRAPSPQGAARHPTNPHQQQFLGLHLSLLCRFFSPWG